MKSRMSLCSILAWLFFMVHAISSSGQTKGAAAEVAPKAGGTGKTYAMVVGISEYQSEMIRPLEFAESDARAVAAYLKSKSGGNIPKENIIELYGKDANSTNVWEKGVGHYFFRKKMFKKGDRLILYFSGHGGAFNTNDRDNAFFFVYDANHATDGDANLKISQIKDLIHTLIEEGVQVIFIFDACRSVDVGVKGGIDQVNQIIEEPQGEVLLTASRGGKVAFESGTIRHGVFTYFLLRGLFGEADQEPKDGVIKGYELDAYLKSKVRGQTQKEFSQEQVPFMMWGLSNSLEETNLFSYDSKEGSLAIASLEKEATTGLPGELMLASRGAKGITSKAAEAYALFEKSLRENRIIRPKNDCAYFYYQKLKAQPEAKNVLETAQNTLSVSLMNMGRLVINDELVGKREYVKQGGSSEGKKLTESGYNDIDLSYYSIPAEALDLYEQITPAEKRNPTLSSMKAYLKARLITVSPSTKEQMAKMLEELEREMKTVDPKPYLVCAKGQLLHNLDRRQEAIASLKEAMRLAPLWSYPVVSLANAFDDMKQTDSAIFYLNSLVERGKDLKDVYAYFYLGTYYGDKGDHAKEQKYYRQAIEINPGFADSWNNLGILKANQFKPDSALYFFRKVLKAEPDNAVILNNVGVMNMRAGYLDSAVYYYRRGIAADPNYIYTWHNWATLLDQGQDRVDTALVVFRQAVKIDPTYQNLYVGIGNCMLKREKFDSAEYYYRKSIQVKPDFGLGLLSIGIVKSLTEQPDSSYYYYLKSVKVEPWPDATVRMGYYHHEREKFDSAIYYYEKTIELNPYFGIAYHQLGHLYQDKEDAAKGEYYLRKAYEVSPNDEDIVRDLGNIKLDMNDNDSATYYFRKAVRINPKYAEGLVSLGATFDQRPDSAAYYYRRAIAADPEEKYAYYNMTFAMEDLGKLDSALYYCLKAVALDPRSVDAVVTAGRINYRLRRWAEAHTYFERTLSIDPLYSYAIVSMGRNVLAQNFPDSAAAYFEQAYYMDPDDGEFNFNLACVRSYRGDVKAAYKTLQDALKVGFDDFDMIRKDEFLANLRKSQDLEPLIKKYSKKKKK